MESSAETLISYRTDLSRKRDWVLQGIWVGISFRKENVAAPRQGTTLASNGKRQRGNKKPGKGIAEGEGKGGRSAKYGRSEEIKFAL